METLTDAYILDEVARLQYLFALKRVIRYGHDRSNESLHTESVAEHLYGMQVLATYFLPREDPAGEWDRQRIRELIFWHDVDEIETGDVIGYLKTDADRARARKMREAVLNNIPASMRTTAEERFEEYSLQHSIESRFVKAIDRFEPTIHLFNEDGKRTMLHNRSTRDEHSRIKDPYVTDFPCIKRFNDCITEKMEVYGYFAQ